jgi:hypothetical protein
MNYVRAKDIFSFLLRRGRTRAMVTTGVPAFFQSLFELSAEAEP